MDAVHDKPIIDESIKSKCGPCKDDVEGLKKDLIDVIYYSNPDCLCKKLKLYYKAKSLGITGLDDLINESHKELIKIMKSRNQQYNELYNAIFKNK